jgi:hypothetical protein
MRKLSTRADRRIAASHHDIWAYRLDFLLVPDAIPSSVDQQLLATGTEQIGDELDRMAELLEARTRTPSIS